MKEPNVLRQLRAEYIKEISNLTESRECPATFREGYRLGILYAINLFEQETENDSQTHTLSTPEEHEEYEEKMTAIFCPTCNVEHFCYPNQPEHIEKDRLYHYCTTCKEWFNTNLTTTKSEQT